jgi:hypothetical protein
VHEQQEHGGIDKKADRPDQQEAHDLAGMPANVRSRVHPVSIAIHLRTACRP